LLSALSLNLTSHSATFTAVRRHPVSRSARRLHSRVPSTRRRSRFASLQGGQTQPKHAESSHVKQLAARQFAAQRRPFEPQSQWRGGMCGRPREMIWCGAGLDPGRFTIKTLPARRSQAPNGLPHRFLPRLPCVTEPLLLRGPLNGNRVGGGHRGYWDYDGGGLGDMATHHLWGPACALGRDLSCPVEAR